MVVLITNITDVPRPDGKKQKPRPVRIFNTEISPGSSLRIDAKFVDRKMRKLEEAGWVSIGKVPPWYEDYKTKRRKVAKPEAATSLATPKSPAVEKKPEPKPAPKAAPAKRKKVEPPARFDISDVVEAPADTITAKESKGSKKKE